MKPSYHGLFNYGMLKALRNFPRFLFKVRPRPFEIGSSKIGTLTFFKFGSRKWLNSSDFPPPKFEIGKILLEIFDLEYVSLDSELISARP